LYIKANLQFVVTYQTQTLYYVICLCNEKHEIVIFNFSLRIEYWWLDAALRTIIANKRVTPGRSANGDSANEDLKHNIYSDTEMFSSKQGEDGRR